MLAEDNPADVFLVREALKNHQIECELEVISDGDEALRYIDRLDMDSSIPCFALLLLDMHLPKRDGEQILNHLRASERCRMTPVIIMTSSTVLPKAVVSRGELHYFEKSSRLDEFMLLGPLIRGVLDASLAVPGR